MKNYLGIFLLIFSFPLLAQVAQYLTINSAFLVSATKEGQAYRFTNKNILVNLDYQTGNFILNLANRDFYISDSVTNNTLQDSLTRQQYSFTGILPINDILGQQLTEQSYNIELQLVNEALNLNQTLNISMDITVPNSSGQANYRIFNMSGTLDNSQLQLPAFTNFDNEIQFWIQFAGISTSY